MTSVDALFWALSKPVAISWSVPAKIRVKEGVLSWPVDAPILKRHRDPSGDYWKAFLELGGLEDSALDRAVASIARKWGPLGLCEAHSLPSTHPAEVTPGLPPAVEGRLGPCPLRRVEGRFEEPVERWRELSQQAGSIVMARTLIHEDSEVPVELFEAMTQAMPLGLSAPGATPASLGDHLDPVDGDLGVGRVGPIVLRARVSREVAIRLAVDQWLTASDVTPSLMWDEDGFVMAVTARSLFGALTLRLAGDLQAARPLVKCHYGNHWYRQTRRGTYFCGSKGCDRLRQAENQRRRRAGKARTYQARSASPPEVAPDEIP